jgi:hypothetical protein
LCEDTEVVLATDSRGFVSPFRNREFGIHQRALKALKQTCLVIVYGCFMLIGVGCGDSRQPSGKYVSVIRLPASGEEWTETIEFKRNGICYYGHPPTVAECKMVPAWKHDHDLTQRSRFKRAAVRRQTAC